MDFTTLRDMQPGALFKAADEYTAMAQKFGQAAADWGSQVCSAAKKAWTGQAAGAAEASLDTTTNRLTSASSLLMQNGDLLSATGRQFLQLQQELRQLIAWAGQNGLVIHDDGSVAPNPQAPQPPGGASSQAVAQSALAAQLAEVLARASAVDQNASQSLDMNSLAIGSDVTNDPGGPGQPAGPSGTSRGGRNAPAA
ncbi:hypothetical protein LN042_21835 [Kitasatospora sp. RB6PN24]|uniref:hypothetical protein n=1 Tax=Kitasatospora humi TaxID=2893891 RepID=UPI001E383ED1|nr:hypothetical protein [Kitasatospora humi]MCC9309683.1 hypothetical protein [Kitasatospora humi]